MGVMLLVVAKGGVVKRLLSSSFAKVRNLKACICRFVFCGGTLVKRPSVYVFAGGGQASYIEFIFIEILSSNRGEIQVLSA